MFNILGEERSKDAKQALLIADACGYEAYPLPGVPLFFADTPALAAAFEAGWERCREELRPRTEAEIQAAIREMQDEAHAGCGLFYELYAQRFTDSVNDWLPELSEAEQATARRHLAGTDYVPHSEGRWTHDPEDNDITFVPY